MGTRKDVARIHPWACVDGPRVCTIGQWGWLLMGRALFFVLMACGPKAEPPPVLGQLADFRLVDQTGRAFTGHDLRGKVWVADFMFTRCPTVCPRMTERMAAVAERARALPNVAFVSFSVDPDNDTPTALAAYAAAHHADWTFLTGATQSVADELKIAVEKQGGSITHGIHFVLVDGERYIRGYYDSTDDEALKRLWTDLGTLGRK